LKTKIKVTRLTPLQELERIQSLRVYKFFDKYSGRILKICLGVLFLCLFSFARLFYIFKKEVDENDRLQAAKALKNKPILKEAVTQQYNEAIQKIDSNINFTASAAVYKEASTKLEEVNNLRGEIAELLKGKSSEENLTSAQMKIYLLQEKVGLLQTRFLDISDENKKLQQLLTQMIANSKINNNAAKNTKIEALATQVQAIENEKINTQINNATIATGLHLFAVADNNETNQSVEADKIVGSFLLKNITNKPNAEVVVVVLQPDGKVLKNSVWESGTFETKEGKKIYSRKILFESESPEKQVNFSLTPDNFSKGNYTMQVWYNGSMIAKMVKTLS
jgi:hypothetical protein